MKKILPFAMLLVCISCMKEESADPGKPTTFMRYYNGGFDDIAQAFEETPDNGFVILANTQVTDANATVQRTKIKLFKTDQYGNEEWKTIFPAFGDPTTVDTLYFKGRSFIIDDDGAGGVAGFTIIGDSIDWKTGTSYFYIMQTDALGNKVRSKSFPGFPNVNGHSISKDSNGDYIVLALRPNAVDDMILAKLNQNTLGISWLRQYGSGQSINVSNLFIDANDNIYWGGTVKRDFALNEMRFVKTKPDYANTEFDLAYGLAEADEEAGSVSIYNNGSRYLLVGTTDELGSKDILVKQVNASGEEVFSVILGDGAGGTIPEEGNAITSASGGLLILGTTGLDEEKDYTLIKIDIAGNVEWTRVFGSSKEERGVSIKQVSDKSYVILGATTLGGLGSIMLMKTDKEGNIE